MFNKKAKIELTEDQKEQMKLEKEARSIAFKEKIKKVAKGTGLFAAGVAVGIGGTKVYEHFNEKENAADSYELDDEIGNVFTEDRSEEVA